MSIFFCQFISFAFLGTQKPDEPKISPLTALFYITIFLSFSSIPSPAFAKTIQTKNFTYDNTGNITGITETLNSIKNSTSHTDDSLNRLTNTNASGYSRSYKYNSIGNMTGKGGKSYSYPMPGQKRPHAPISDGLFNYTYDNNGNLITKINTKNTERFNYYFTAKNYLKELLSYIPDFEFILTDLSKYSDNDLKCIADFKIGLLLLKYTFRDEFKQKLDSIFPLFKELKEKDSGLEYLHTVLKYIMATAEDINTKELKKLIENNISKDIGENVMTIAEQLRQEGRLEEARDFVLKVLETKFNFVPDKMKSQIKSIEDIEGLEKLHKETITVSNLNIFSGILSEQDLNKH